MIQRIIDALEARSYLEIGVEKGVSFSKVRARWKIAVDPMFKGTIRSQFGAGQELFYEMTSDEFFAKHSTIFSETPVDVALIDGLHTFEQSYRDVTNCLKYLDRNGVIVVHDCNPANETLAYPAGSYEEAAQAGIPDWKGLWCGDVWKTVVYLRASRGDLTVCLLDCDFGVGIIRFGDPEVLLSLNPGTVTEMKYRDLAENREKLLNLKSPHYLDTFLDQLRMARV